MAASLIWTERASADIEAMVRYIARRNPQAAAKVGMGVYQMAQILLSTPDAGNVLDELREGEWRKLIYLRWKIIYTIRGENIIIGRVWPAAMGEADLSTPLEWSNPD